jgi:hypothetical protein
VRLALVNLDLQISSQIFLKISKMAFTESSGEEAILSITERLIGVGVK